jgi:hypothetical protein
MGYNPFHFVVLHGVEKDDWPWAQGNPATSIGFGVLKRFDCFVDGEHALAYLQPSKRWKPFMAAPPKQTLLRDHPGAVFGPWRSQTNLFTAYVMSESSAFQSGIRDGDALLKVDGQEVKQWLDNPGKGWSSGHELGYQGTYPSTNNPTSTMLELTLRRRDQVFQATVLQSEISVIALRRH